MLVLVGTKGAAQSTHVTDEIREFKRTDNGLIARDQGGRVLVSSLGEAGLAMGSQPQPRILCQDLRQLGDAGTGKTRPAAVKLRPENTIDVRYTCRSASDS
jgi:hypothetical protein